MVIYYIIYGVLAILSLKEVFLTKNSKILLLLVTFLFIVFVGIRYGVGNDYFVYLENYRFINKGEIGSSSANEYLYIFSNQILSFDVLIFFYSFFSFYLLHKFIVYFNNGHPVTSYLVYFGIFLITYNIHILRQGLSIAMILYGYKFLYEKKKIPFIIIVLLAAAFHKSALIVLPFIYLINLNLSVKFQLTLLLMAVGIYLLSNLFTDLFYDVAASIPVLNSYLLVYRREEVIASGITIGTIMDICVALALLMKFKDLEGKDLFIYKIFYISVILSLVLSFMPAGLRLNYYFRTCLILALPMLFKYYKFKKATILMILAITYLYLDITFNGEGEYGRGDRNLNYKTIFDEIIY